MPGRWPYRPDDPVAGEAAAWDRLARTDLARAADRVGARYDDGRKEITIRSLGQDVVLSPPRRELRATSALGERLLAELGYLIRPAVIWYPVVAGAGRPGVRPTPVAGPQCRWVAPKELRGGDVFQRGSHRLPLEELGSLLDSDEGRLRASIDALGGRAADIGDAGWDLLVLPLVPLRAGFWHGDEEFPPRAVMLFDASADGLMPIDLLWSVATYTAMALLVED